MSHKNRVEIICDLCQQSKSPQAETITEARENAKENGWDRRMVRASGLFGQAYIDLCPDCLAFADKKRLEVVAKEESL